jgi:GNAT superfamily N-acetyltransferase
MATKRANPKKNKAARRARHGSAAPVISGPAAAGRLAQGWNGPAGTVLRLARPGEAAGVARLADTTGGPLDEYMHAAIEDGTASAGLLAGLRTGKEALLRPAARAGAAHDPAPFTELSLALVAERNHQLAGALYALPPGAVIAQMMEQGVDPPHALLLAIAAIKIKALATVPAHRGQGIASALLHHCVRLYGELGYYLLYGTFATSSGLESFYAAHGFDVLPPGAGISLDVLLGQPARIGTEPGEQFFTRWR